jgi:hypothetical protein
MEVLMYEPASSNSFGAVFYLVWLALYLYFAYAQYKIAQKVGHSSPWWAFIPIINMFQWVQMARKEWYWFLFLFVPIVNVVCLAILLMDVAKACHKSPLWGFLTLIPFINFVSIGVMAFSGPEPAVQSPSHDHSQTRQPEKVS